MDEELDIIEDETYQELKQKNEYLTTHKSCPQCDFYPLEYQIYGFEKVIFCPRCEYSVTHNI